MRCGLQSVKTADTLFHSQKKFLYALFRRQVDFRQALLSSSTGRASQGRRATTCERLDAVSPVPARGEALNEAELTTPRATHAHDTKEAAR
jgi:hypothetical protein